MKIIAPQEAKMNKNKTGKEAITVKRIMVVIGLISLMIGVNSAYAVVDEGSRNLVIANKEYRRFQDGLFKHNKLMVNYNSESLKGDLR